MDQTTVTELQNKAREYRQEYASEESKRKSVETQITDCEDTLERIREFQSNIEKKYNNIRNVIKAEENTDIGPIM